MRLPEWIRVERKDLHQTKRLLRGHRLLTVCEEARCPNQGKCFSKPTATFMLLGRRCTRNCGFCAVDTSMPEPIDPMEPERILGAARIMDLRYVVLTSVTRDDLSDGGAGQFAKTVGLLKRNNIKVEVLTPDFQGSIEALRVVLDAGPDVFNHNLETVPRLYPVVRPMADYRRSLFILQRAKEIAPGIFTKSGIMLGLGEEKEEIMQAMDDLRGIGCDFLTIGQYLRPTKENMPVVNYVRPEVFDEYRDIGLKKGFKAVASGPLVRSSMNAEEIYNV